MGGLQPDSVPLAADTTHQDKMQSEGFVITNLSPPPGA